jgi:citrate lyase subunit beta/citryl-CoA lyase
VLRAKSIVEAFEKAQGGAVQLDGKMIDRPVFLLAQRLLNSI